MKILRVNFLLCSTSSAWGCVRVAHCVCLSVFLRLLAPHLFPFYYFPLINCFPLKHVSCVGLSSFHCLFLLSTSAVLVCCRAALCIHCSSSLRLFTPSLFFLCLFPLHLSQPSSRPSPSAANEPYFPSMSDRAPPFSSLLASPLALASSLHLQQSF